MWWRNKTILVPTLLLVAVHLARPSSGEQLLEAPRNRARDALPARTTRRKLKGAAPATLLGGSNETDSAHHRLLKRRGQNKREPTEGKRKRAKKEAGKNWRAKRIEGQKKKKTRANKNIKGGNKTGAKEKLRPADASQEIRYSRPNGKPKPARKPKNQGRKPSKPNETRTSSRTTTSTSADEYKVTAAKDLCNSKSRYRTCLTRPRPPSSEPKCSSISKYDKKPPLYDDERFISGDVTLTLLDPERKLNCANAVRLEETLLTFLADNIGDGGEESQKHDTFEPVCVSIQGTASSSQDLIDSKKGSDVLGLLIEVTFVQKASVGDWSRRLSEADSLEADLELLDGAVHWNSLKGEGRKGDGLPLFHGQVADQQSTVNRELRKGQCSAIEVALCCTQYVINGYDLPSGQFCKDLGCDIDQCGTGRYPKQYEKKTDDWNDDDKGAKWMSDGFVRRLFTEEYEAHRDLEVSETVDNSLEQRHLKLNFHPNSRCPRYSFRVSSPSWYDNFYSTAYPDRTSASTYRSSWTDHSSSKSGKFGKSQGKNRGNSNKSFHYRDDVHFCPAYGLLKDSDFVDALNCLTPFESDEADAQLDIQSLSSATICAANRYNVENYDEPSLDCSDFDSKKCDGANDDILPGLGRRGVCLNIIEDSEVRTALPTFLPTLLPTLSPSLSPSLSPTLLPTLSPSLSPSLRPTLSPTLIPSLDPVQEPTLSPTFFPSLSPTIDPTLAPSISPTISPSISPTINPTLLQPSRSPAASDPTSAAPTSKPGPQQPPSKMPTYPPTSEPIFSPSFSPTESPVMAPELGNIGTNRIPVPVTEGQTTLIGALENSSPAPPLPNPLRLTQIIRQARNGSCARNNPRGRRIAYTPQDGYFGRDRCTYEICDSRGMCGNVELFVLVEPGETPFPTRMPTRPPTRRPSRSLPPTSSPTTDPTETPTESPSVTPTRSPNGDPTMHPSMFPTLAPSDSPTSGPTSEPALQPVINNYGKPRDRVRVEFNATTRLRVLETSKAAEGQGPLFIFNITEPARQGTCEITVRELRIDYTPRDFFDDRCSYLVCDQRNQCAQATLYIRVSLFEPSSQPSGSPTLPPVPTVSPKPSGETLSPTGEPTGQAPDPSIRPSKSPTSAPTLSPSFSPTLSPSFSPTDGPSTTRPSRSPAIGTDSPTFVPDSPQLTMTIQGNTLEATDFDVTPQNINVLRGTIIDIAAGGLSDGQRVEFAVVTNITEEATTVIVEYELGLGELCGDIPCSTLKSSTTMYDVVTSFISDEIANGGFTTKLQQNAATCGDDCVGIQSAIVNNGSAGLDDIIITTQSPTVIPTKSPSFTPTVQPTIGPTFTPTFQPTSNPSFTPTFSPTLQPSYFPTNPQAAR